MEQELMFYGLSENEAKVFLVCLKVGESTANRVAELANLPRSTIYDVLEKLKQRGLISTCLIGSKTHFIASNPEVLITSLEEKKSKIKKILPNLKTIQNKIKEKPVSEVFHGKNAIIKLLDEILENSKELKIIGNQGNALEKIDYHPEKFKLKRFDKKVKLKQILEISEESKKIKKDKFTEVKYLDSLNDSKEAMFICGDFVVHMILQYEISAIRVKSKEHSKSMEIMFDELWKKSKTL